VIPKQVISNQVIQREPAGAEGKDDQQQRVR